MSSDPNPARRTGVQALLAAALERRLSGGDNLRQLGVEALCREAGVARSSFYLHFRNRDELLRHVLGGVRDELSAAAGDWFTQPERVERRHIDTAVREIVGVYEKHHAVMHAAVEAAADDPALDAIYRDILRSLLRTNRRTVLRSASGHTMQANVTEEVGDVLLYMIERCSYQLRRVDDRAQRERTIQALGHVVWNSLFAEP